MQTSWVVLGAIVVAAFWYLGDRRSASASGLPTIAFNETPHPAWRALNDDVMGGVSEGRIGWETDGMRWTGHTRLENNGGFSSIRGPWEAQNLGSMQYAIVRCKGTGGPFKLVFERSQRWWMPYIYAEFSPEPEWSDVKISVDQFKWSQAFTGDVPLGSVTAGMEDVLRIGMMKYDGTAQPFDLEVASIRFE